MAGKILIATIPLDLSKKIGTKSFTHEYRSGQTIFTQGDKAEAIFYIHSGHVKLTVTSKGARKPSSASCDKGICLARAV